MIPSYEIEKDTTRKPGEKRIIRLKGGRRQAQRLVKFRHYTIGGTHIPGDALVWVPWKECTREERKGREPRRITI